MGILTGMVTMGWLGTLAGMGALTGMGDSSWFSPYLTRTAVCGMDGVMAVLDPTTLSDPTGTRCYALSPAAMPSCRRCRSCRSWSTCRYGMGERGSF